MTKSEFWLNYASNLDYAFLSLLISAMVYFIFFRKYIYSILDPLALHILMSVCASSVVIFLFQTNLIQSFYFYNFILTQLFFIFGFILVKPLSIRTLMKDNRKQDLFYGLSAKYLFILAIFLYYISILFTYYINGIPLFMESRLDTFSGGSGFGIFGRIIPVTMVIITSISFYNIFFIKKKTYMLEKVVISSVIINSLLSGSKSQLLVVFFILFFVLLFNMRTFNNRLYSIYSKFLKYKWYLMIGSVIAVLIIINIQASTRFGSDNTMNPLMILIMRLINSGDIFYLAYPDGFINHAATANPIEALFSPILGTFRLISWQDLPDSIGLQLHQLLYKTDLIEGPNTRHNVFGLFYLGPYMSILFSFVLGYLTSYFRNKFYFKVSKSVNGMIIYILISLNILSFEIDPVMTISNLLSIVIVLIPLYVFSKVLEFNQNKKKEIYVGN